jgi:2-methylcitrate dehydratase MmgE/PrpD-like protein
MHNPAAHSAVSDALVKFASGPLTEQGAPAVAAAARAVAHARSNLASLNHAGRQTAALLLSQGSGPDDTRVQAWALGATLANEQPATTATPVIAAVVAIGELASADSDKLAAAAAVGMEAALRIRNAVDSDEFRARWNVASAIGVLGAVLAVSRLLKLDDTRVRNALGIAATQSAGLAHNAGQPLAALEVGKAAADAIEAALMAKHGFTSAPASIDGRRGFGALMAYRFDAASIIEGLGTQWVSLR